MASDPHHIDSSLKQTIPSDSFIIDFLSNPAMLDRDNPPLLNKVRQSNIVF
jgi:hypothetical protein